MSPPGKREVQQVRGCAKASAAQHAVSQLVSCFLFAFHCFLFYFTLAPHLQTSVLCFLPLTVCLS